MGNAPRRRGPTAGAPRLAAPARLLRASDGSASREADREERPDPLAGCTRTVARAPRAPTRLPRAYRRAHSARSDALTRRAPTAHLQRARRDLPARRRAHVAHSVRTHATRDTRHHSHVPCVTDPLFTVCHLCVQETPRDGAGLV